MIQSQNHQEIKISDGVYITDFRKGQALKGLGEKIQSNNPLTKDLGLLLDELKALESRVSRLVFSNQAIKQEQEWQKQQAYIDAIMENFKAILSMTQQMKQKILEINSLNYFPDTEEMQKLISSQRVAKRQEQIRKEIGAFIKHFKITLQETKKQGGLNQLAEVKDQSNSDSQEDQGVYV